MKTCLIIDASDVMRRLVAHMSRALGLEPREAASANDALESLNSRAPDVVLVDAFTLGSQAQEFLTLFRGYPNGRRARIIICTTDNDARVLTRYLTAGADDYLIKPYTRDELAARFVAGQLIAPASVRATA